MSDPVLQWAGYAQQAAKKYHVPTAVLLGLTSVETGGREGLTSSTGAKGLTQFEPGTAAQYGVDTSPGHARSQLEGTAAYLNALGFQKDPRRALAAYNGGPGNPQYGYADKVLAAARRYGNLGGLPVAAAPATDTAAGGAQGLIDTTKRSQALDALLTVALVAGGAGLIYLGVNQSTGGALHSAVKGATLAGEAAAA